RAGEVLPLRVLAPDIPKALERIILRAMDHRPENRYANAAALADDLEQFVRQPATDRSEPPARQECLPHHNRKRLLQGAAGLVLLVGWMVASNWLSNNGPEKAPPKHDDIGDAPVLHRGNNGDSSDPIPPKLVKVEAFSGRERPLRTKINLLRDDLQPVMYKQ